MGKWSNLTNIFGLKPPTSLKMNHMMTFQLCFKRSEQAHWTNSLNSRKQEEGQPGMQQSTQWFWWMVDTRALCGHRCGCNQYMHAVSSLTLVPIAGAESSCWDVWAQHDKPWRAIAAADRGGQLDQIHKGFVCLCLCTISSHAASLFDWKPVFFEFTGDLVQDANTKYHT